MSCFTRLMIALRGWAGRHLVVCAYARSEQFPLTIDFVSTAQGEAIQLLVVAEIAEHRLDGGEATAVLLATFVAVDACAHRLRMRSDVLACEHGDLSHFAGVRFAQALRP